MTEQRVLFVETISEDRPADVPESWTIYNASRPLPGHKTWTGDFRHGVFFAAVAPEGDPVDEFNDSARFHKQCQSLDGWECVWVSLQDVEKYGRKLAADYGMDYDEWDFDDVLFSYQNRFNKSGA